MRRLADHHPARRIERRRRLKGATRVPRACATPGPRKIRTYVKAFWIPGLGSKVITGAAIGSVVSRHRKRAPFVPHMGGYVEGKALPKHRYLR